MAAANRERKIKHGLVELLEARNLLTSKVIINEIYYDPPDKTEASEYIELYNTSAEAIDLSDWTLSDGLELRIPVGVTIEPGGYVVAAQDPVTLKSVFGIDAIGPWTGRLKNSGERVQLRDDLGTLVDEVDYARGFPWPTVGDAPGHSIELIHPSLENEHGGNWRRAGSVEAGAAPSLVSRGATWKYFLGLTAPSERSSGWRQVDFDDESWSSGVAPIGYGDDHVATTLRMRGRATTLYLRHPFQVDDVAAIKSLSLSAQFDDGFNLWINGKYILGENVASRTGRHDATATSALENRQFVKFDLPDPGRYLVDGTNVIAVQLLNASLNGSSDAWFDADLSVMTTGSHSPGRQNTAFRTNAPPATMRVSHGDVEFRSGEEVPIMALVSDPDGVESVTLEYQTVRPGDYFGRYVRSSGATVLNPRYDDAAEWTTLVMRDDGIGGDREADDGIFTAVIPGAVQQHRHLIRYRIAVVDTLGASAQVPYEDDPQHNFAYFVYDGVPDWTASIRPRRTPEVTHKLSEFNSLATYHLLTTQDDHQNSQHIPGSTTSSYSGEEYLWTGTLVYDGQVYDNIRYRARGGVWRYAMGKNMWKFDFNRGHGFQAKDNYGQEYSETWDKLNFSALIQQGNYLHRGEQGLFESVGFKLFNLAGVESPNTHFVHFRVIDTEDEHGDDQFSGDFQGLYLAIEQPDGRFLDEHDLPDGNLYKIEGHRGSSNNQGPTQASDGSDVAAFISGYRNRNPNAEWWEENLDLQRYYSYRTIVEGIHHYDIAYGKNYFYYHNPETDKFQVHPWDLDLTWADNMFGSGDHDFLTKVARNDVFEVDYQNRVRELRDLLYNPEQTGMLIDEFAAMVHQPGALSWVDADRAMWDYNPILRSSQVNPSKAGHGRFHESSSTGDFDGMVQLMKDYVLKRSQRLDRANRTDRRAPETPTVRYVGDSDFALDELTFQTSPFLDPETAEFAAMEWRIAEITDPQNPHFGTVAPKYEITPTWESGELSVFDPRWEVPADMVSEGSLYRVRVRMKNAAGIWSHWSDPIQFTASAASFAEASATVASSLRISEVHYHPPAPTPAEIAAGFDDADEFEFIELVNVGMEPVDLSRVSFQRIDVDGMEEGVEFEFDEGRKLGPGEFLLVVENVDAFGLRYGDDLPVVGQWAGKLGNGGEQVTLIDDGVTIYSFAYDDEWYEETDGGGFSLEVIDPASTDPIDLNQAAAWEPSKPVGGTPGAPRVATLVGDFDDNQVVNADDIDLLNAAIAAASQDALFDLDADGLVARSDVDVLVEEVIGTVYGDVNLDREVDFADFLMLAANFGKSKAGWSDADLDGDQTVSFADFLVLAANFGKLGDFGASG